MTQEVENQPGTEPNLAANAEVELDIGAVTPEDADGEKTPVVESDQPVQYQETGDPGLDMALGFIGKLGIGPDHPGVLAAKTGDFSFIKAHLAGLGDKARGWEQYMALAERAYTSAQQTANAKAADTRKVVEDAVGGADNWSAIQAWAKANADDSERAEINAMLNAGGMRARAAARLLSDLYNQAHDTVHQPAEAAKANATRVPATNGPLTPNEYNKELQALIGRIGAHKVGESPEYQQLQQRRRAFRG